jgi:ABC-2 type transport system permease protein
VTTRWGTEVPLDKWGKALEIDDHAGYPVMDRHFERLWATFAEQQRAQEWAGLALPILALRAFSMGIAGTDFAHHRQFAVAAEQHRRLIQDLMSEDLVAHADPQGRGHFQYQAGSDLWTRVPRFSYSAPAVEWALHSNLRSFGILAASLAIAVALAHIAVWRQHGE